MKRSLLAILVSGIFVLSAYYLAAWYISPYYDQEAPRFSKSDTSRHAESATEQDDEPANARRIIVRPSDIGKTDTPIERGITSYHAGDNDGARREFQTACDSGTIFACVNLAGMYESGRAGLQDFVRARELYSKACDGGVLYACRSLGELYENAQGGPQDFALARSSYERACNGGGKYNCGSFGKFVFLGLGGQSNKTLGESILRKACTNEADLLSCDFLVELGLEPS